MSRVKMGFLGLSVPNQIERSRLVLGSVGGNPVFPLPDPSVADGNIVTDALEVAFNNSRGGDRDLMALMRIRQKAVLAYHRRLAAYVQATSGGDEEIILSSGYDVVRRGEPLAPVGQVLNLRLKNGSEPGSFRALWDRVVGAGAYNIEIADESSAPESFRPYKTVLQTRITLTGLTPGQAYWIRVCAVGRTGYGLWSDTGWRSAELN